MLKNYNNEKKSFSIFQWPFTRSAASAQWRMSPYYSIRREEKGGKKKLESLNLFIIK